MKFVQQAGAVLKQTTHTVGTRETYKEADHCDTGETHWEDAHGCTGKNLWKGVSLSPLMQYLRSPFPTSWDAACWQGSLGIWATGVRDKAPNKEEKPLSSCSIFSPTSTPAYSSDKALYWLSKGKYVRGQRRVDLDLKSHDDWYNGYVCMHVSVCVYIYIYIYIYQNDWRTSNVLPVFKRWSIRIKVIWGELKNLVLIILWRHWLFISLAPFVYSIMQFKISPQGLNSYNLLT